MRRWLGRVWATGVVLAGLQLGASRSDAALVTLDFGTGGGEQYGDNPLFVPGGAYTEDSFTITALDSSGGTDPGYHFDVVGGGGSDERDLFMHSGLDAGPSSHADWVRVSYAGGAFDLLSLDVELLLSPDGAPPADLVVVTSLGGVQTLTFGVNTFMGSPFRGVTFFDLQTSPLPLDDPLVDRYRFRVDDIVLGVSVPEPSSLGLVLGGLAALAARGLVSVVRSSAPRK